MRLHRSYWLGFVLLATLAPLPAQVGYPGQYPPGQYPPSGYPGNGGVGFPMPGRHKKNKNADQDVQLQSTEGMLRRIEKDQVILEADDSRILNFKRTDSTKFVKDGDPVKPAELKPGDHLLIEASQDDQGFLTAVNVVWQQDGSAADRKHAAEAVETSTARSSDDEDRPVLRRSDAPAQAAEAPQGQASAPVAKPFDLTMENALSVLTDGGVPVAVFAYRGAINQTEKDAFLKAHDECAQDQDPAAVFVYLDVDKLPNIWQTIAKDTQDAVNQESKSAFVFWYKNSRSPAIRGPLRDPHAIVGGLQTIKRQVDGNVQAANPAAQAPNPADLNTPVKDAVPAVAIDPGDEGPPVLKRGKTAVYKNAQPPPTLSAKNAPSAGAQDSAPEDETRPAVLQARETQRPEDVVIEKAREAAGNFLEGLPNYICQEYMARFVSTSHVVSWQPQDVVSAEVVYEDRHEHYRNVAINGKVTKKNMQDLPGAWSTGEFGTVLADLFSPATAADFRYRRETRSGGRAALLYDFSVDRQHSGWKIMVASQSVLPAYTGSLWIDKESKRVLRIEMQAAHLPEAFPSDKVESATDYEFVRFGDREFLVPVRAETLSCQRGTDNCSRNTIDFRNYHKYSGESSITFEK